MKGIWPDPTEVARRGGSLKSLPEAVRGMWTRDPGNEEVERSRTSSGRGFARPRGDSIQKESWKDKGASQPSDDWTLIRPWGSAVTRMHSLEKYLG